MNIEKIETVVRYHQERLTGKLSLGFMDLNSGNSFALHGDERYPMASTFKVFILAELLRQAEAGCFSMDDRIELKNHSNTFGSGILSCIDEGARLTIRDYATLMIIISDNSAADILFDIVGQENIKTNIIDGLELKNTRCDLACRDMFEPYLNAKPGGDVLAAVSACHRNTPAYLCQTEKGNETSPLDMMKLMEKVYKKQLFSSTVCNEMIRIMKQCKTNMQIPRYLPRSVSVAHKTGTCDRVTCDVGIVYTPKGDYILVLNYNGNVASQEEYDKNTQCLIGADLLADVSKDIYDAYMD